MPLYSYRAKRENNSCKYCSTGFEALQHIKDKPLTKCPKCNAPVKKVLSTFSMPESAGNFDSRAKAKGFHKLKKVDKGKYEKLY